MRFELTGEKSGSGARNCQTFFLLSQRSVYKFDRRESNRWELQNNQAFPNFGKFCA